VASRLEQALIELSKSHRSKLACKALLRRHINTSGSVRARHAKTGESGASRRGGGGGLGGDARAGGVAGGRGP
jgi:hypothetical protein